jgi:hypothetical protein
MPTLTSNDINKLVSLTFYPGVDSIIGTAFTNVKVKAILDHESVFQWIDPISMHANLYPSVFAGNPAIPNDYKGYLYAKIQLADGKMTVVGLPWISSFVVHTNTTIQTTVSDAQPADINRIRDILLLNGFRIQELKFLD